MPGQAKDPTKGDKCVTCCGLPFFNIAEVRITGVRGREIKKNGSNTQNAHNRANAEEEEEEEEENRETFQ
jgi:hypothetical protein